MAIVKRKNKNNYDAYKSTEISTANQTKLIVMLYDGAIRFLKTAIDNMDPRSYDTVNTNIVKTQDIITELMISLDMDRGGEIAHNLLNLYAYIKKRLLEGNISKESSILMEVVKLLEGLKASWEEVSQKEAGKTQMNSSLPREEGISFSIRG